MKRPTAKNAVNPSNDDFLVIREFMEIVRQYLKMKRIQASCLDNKITKKGSLT